MAVRVANTTGLVAMEALAAAAVPGQVQEVHLERESLAKATPVEPHIQVRRITPVVAAAALQALELQQTPPQTPRLVLEATEHQSPTPERLSITARVETDTVVPQQLPVLLVVLPLVWTVPMEQEPAVAAAVAVTAATALLLQVSVARGLWCFVTARYPQLLVQRSTP